MRLVRERSAVGTIVRRAGTRHRTALAVFGGALAVLPAFAASGTAADWVNLASTERTGTATLQGGYDPVVVQIGVDGSLPQAPAPVALPAYEVPSGPLGIPASALKAYRNAATIMGKEQPACRIDWALIASIGRIESNHARGGYVDAKGNTREPILGPVLNGEGPVAAIPDTDQGRYDGDTVWDRAVGPTQFIPSTWYGYASDGNGDGETNPNNIYDATLGTGRYLCSGGLDVSKPDELRAAIYRYNNSDTYVNTVIIWAQAYRSGVAPSPDSQVPVGAPNATTAPAPSSVPVPPAPTTTTTKPSTTIPDEAGTSSSSTSGSSGNQIPGETDDPTTTTTTTTEPTCTSKPPTTTPSPPTTTLPPCKTSDSPVPPSDGSSAPAQTG